MPGDASELERLRTENRALDEQVKLLVQTEQRFYRSQSQLDRQLVRLERLAAFALETTRLHSATHVLERAVAMLCQTYELDWAGALAFEDSPAGLHVLVESDPRPGQPPRVTLAAADLDWLRALDRPQLADPAAGGAPAALMAALDPALAEAARMAGAHLVLVPVARMGRERRGLLVSFTAGGRRRLTRPDDGDEHQRPFLQLLANHVEHAVDNSELTDSLRKHGERLVHSLETLERTQEQLVQAQKMDAIGRLAGGVAHDFNNLLTVILGYAGALAADLPPEAPQHENVTRVLVAARRAADVTSQLLALGRRQMHRLEPLDLSGQAARTAEVLARIVGEDIRIDLDLERGLPPVHADRSQLEQVLLNLVVHARDAMPRGGRLRIATRAAAAADAARCGDGVDAARFAVLEVRDDGAGMDAPTLARAFEPFVASRGDGRGGGLGLAVVYGIVTQSEGHVFADSAPGQGSCFTVLLPYAERSATTAAPSRAPAPAVASAAGSVLVVEDEPALREVVRETLRRAGHRVSVAGNGEEALALLEHTATPPDLVLTDVTMPGLGGLPLAERLAARYPGLRVAFMSGYSEDLLEGRAPEARAFLAKPFTPRDLIAFVGAQLASPR